MKLTKDDNTPALGALRVWWIPQVPMKPFYVPVRTQGDALLILDTLGRYDAFQYENNIKPDYSNAGGLEIYEPDGEEGSHDWCEWYDDETGEPIDFFLADWVPA